MKYEDFLVSSLGKGGIVSPLKHTRRVENPVYKFVDDSDRILYDVSLDNFKDAVSQENFLSLLRKPVRKRQSISNLQKRK